MCIKLPYGEQIKYTHTFQIEIPWLPEGATRFHIVPGLAHTSLVYIKILCDAGCKIEYNASKCGFIFNQKIVWKGTREPTTGLLVLLLDPKHAYPEANFQVKSAYEKLIKTEIANNAYTITSNRDLIHYLHQCLFCITKETLLKSIANNHFTTWPGLTYSSVKKYLPEHFPDIDKVHMKRQKQVIRSTNKSVAKELKRIETVKCMNPPI